MQEYYLQNKRGSNPYVGNSLLWWAYNDCGYTVDIRCAKRWSHGEYLEKKQHLRECDIFWPCDVIDPLVQHHIDMQDLIKDNKGEYRKVSHVISSYRPDLTKPKESEG